MFNAGTKIMRTTCQVVVLSPEHAGQRRLELSQVCAYPHSVVTMLGLKPKRVAFVAGCDFKFGKKDGIFDTIKDTI